MPCDSECRFEDTNENIEITFECGNVRIAVYWTRIPRIGDFVTIKPPEESAGDAISGVVGAVAWSEDKYGFPEVTLTVVPKVAEVVQ